MNYPDDLEICKTCPIYDECPMSDPYECQREADAVRDDAERDWRLGK